MSYAEVKPDFAKQSKNTSIELYKIILNTYLLAISRCKITNKCRYKGLIGRRYFGKSAKRLAKTRWWGVVDDALGGFNQ